MQGCEWCSEKIEPGDSGSIVPPGVAYHRECFIRFSIGSVGHQMGICSCYFPDNPYEDPPELTLREAAELAFARFTAGGYGEEFLSSPEWHAAIKKYKDRLNWEFK